MSDDTIDRLVSEVLETCDSFVSAPMDSPEFIYSLGRIDGLRWVRAAVQRAMKGEGTSGRYVPAELSTIFIAEEIYDYETGWSARERLGVHSTLERALAAMTRKHGGDTELMAEKVPNPQEILGVSKPGIVAAYMVYLVGQPPEDPCLHDVWIFEERVDP